MCSRLGVTATAISDRALALAADDLVRLVAAPVDELVQRLETELRRNRELLHLVDEALLADAVDEGVEHLAVLPLGLVHPDPALHRLGHALGRKADLEPPA